MLLCHVSHSVVSDSLRHHGLEPTRLLCPRNSPGKNSGVGSHALLQGILPTQELNSGLLHCRQILYCLSYPGNPLVAKCQLINYKCSGGEASRKSLPGWWLFQIGILINSKAGKWRLMEVQDIGYFGIPYYKIFISHKDKYGDSRVKKTGRKWSDQVTKVWHHLGLARVTLCTSLWNAVWGIEQ